MQPTITLFENFHGGSPDPLFKLRATLYGVICESRESDCIYWLDYGGSICKYYALRGKTATEAEIRDRQFNTLLMNFDPARPQQFRLELMRLLQILPEANYSCIYHPPIRRDIYEGFGSGYFTFDKFDRTRMGEEELKEIYRKEWEAKIQEETSSLWGYQGDYFITPSYLDFVGNVFYDGPLHHIIATKHVSQLDTQRVAWYKNEILKGANPAILVLTGLQNDFRHRGRTIEKTNSFIIDGHHKARAYYELRKVPAVIELVSEIPESTAVIQDLKLVSRILYREQMIHLVKNLAWFSATRPYMDAICADPDLGTFCLNGKVTEFHPNGQPAVIGNYFNSLEDGEFRHYFPNGILEVRHIYEMGRLKTTLEKYFYEHGYFYPEFLYFEKYKK